jgi:hypothetical protein
MVRTTRRERFMGGLKVCGQSMRLPFRHGRLDQASQEFFLRHLQLPLEKCPENARANDPKPPRITPPEPESEDAPDEEWPDEVSLLKKPWRNDHDPPWPPLPDEDPGEQPVCEIAGAAMPRDGGVQFSRGISA